LGEIDGESFFASMRLESSVMGRKASSSVGINVLRFCAASGVFLAVFSRGFFSRSTSGLRIEGGAVAVFEA